LVREWGCDETIAPALNGDDIMPHSKSTALLRTQNKACLIAVTTIGCAQLTSASDPSPFASSDFFWSELKMQNLRAHFFLRFASWIIVAPSQFREHSPVAKDLFIRPLAQFAASLLASSLDL